VPKWVAWMRYRRDETEAPEMPVTVTAIDVVPLQEDDPEARASYRITVLAGGQAYHLLFTVLDFEVPEVAGGLTGLHAHSANVERELVPRHFDYGGQHPLCRLVFATYRDTCPTLPVVINDRGLISASSDL
jgi:hypothetical protein